MTARIFEDSTGTRWEVFEVRRSSQKALAVSAGLELGWLAFGSGVGKRRLAPIPEHWETADDRELERLCGLARVIRDKAEVDRGGVRASGKAGDVAGPVVPSSSPIDARRATPGATSRVPVPRIRQSRVPSAKPHATLPILATATSDDPVETTVREYARQARELDLPAIEAMVQLKALLARVYPDADSGARDLRAVRRWFVEAFYFERDVPSVDADADDQSR